MAEVVSNRWLPWRSAVLGWLVAFAFVVVGVPLFVRMPLWSDVTLYAVAARTVADGGAHYRDVFDTNPPGFVWLLCAVRAVLGTSSEALRFADLAIVVLVTLGLMYWARGCGARRADAAWLATSVAAFYLFSHEFNHVQRDMWMMLPAGAAVALRLRRAEARTSFVSAIVEGLFWGLGCWIKPHLILIAFAVWLATRARFSWRDALLVFTGGIIALAGGVVWLVASGTWPHFVEIWRTWNADYLATVMRELPFRVVMQLQYFPPYSACAILAVPLAVVNVRNRSEEPEALRRKVLAAVYLGWLLMALLLQRPFHYVHVPETLLMLAVFAANRWAVPFVLVVMSLSASAVFALSGWGSPHVPPHEAFDANRTRWWTTCFEANPPREVHTGVAMYAQSFSANDPAELGPVADFLRTQNMQDGELIAWHDSPHALYLDLNVKPRFRFMHVGTAAGLGKWQEEQVLRELQAALPHARFAVSDMHRITAKYSELNDLDADGLPKVLPAWQRAEFPFNQPVVFRSPNGRYLVHRIEKPVTSARIPKEMDQQKPNAE